MSATTLDAPTRAMLATAESQEIAKLIRSQQRQLDAEARPRQRAILLDNLAINYGRLSEMCAIRRDCERQA